VKDKRRKRKALLISFSYSLIVEQTSFIKKEILSGLQISTLKTSTLDEYSVRGISVKYCGSSASLDISNALVDYTFLSRTLKEIVYCNDCNFSVRDLLMR